MKYYEWGALGRVDKKSGKFYWGNPGDSYYIVLGFVATAFWDGQHWVRIPGREPIV